MAPFFGCAALTGMGMIYNEAKPKKRDYFINWTWWNWFFQLLECFSKGIKNFIVLDTNEKKEKLLKNSELNIFII